jgi:hypothetical protein
MCLVVRIMPGSVSENENFLFVGAFHPRRLLCYLLILCWPELW